MRLIPDLPLEFGDVDSYRGLLKLIVQNAPAQGMTVAEMRKAMRVVDAIDASHLGEPIILEDEDWQYAKQRVETHVFRAAHKDLIAFVDAVVGAKEPEKS